MNLTLSVDEKLLKDARRAALEMDTTVNGLVRKYLQELVKKEKEKRSLFIDDWRELMDNHPVDMKSASWTRDELHER